MLTPTPAQDSTICALRVFAKSGSWTTPVEDDPRIVQVGQGRGSGVFVTTDGLPFIGSAVALAHQRVL